MSAETRRDMLFSAVESVFEQAGLEGLTMDAIAAEAGMSKRTIYGVFADRDDLLHGYMARIRSDYVRPLQPGDLDLPLEERLRRLLAPVERRRASGLPLTVLRLAVAEAGQRPEGARLCRARGVERDRALIRAELDRAVARGEAAIADTGAAAALLEAMIRPAILDLLLDPARRPDAAEVRARFELGLGVFLRGLGVASEAGDGGEG